jgi:hypothetical protein
MMVAETNPTPKPEINRPATICYQLKSSTRREVTYKTETIGGGGLENVSDDENSTSRDNGPSSTNVIGHITSNQSTKESTSGKNGGDEGFLPSGESELFSGDLRGVETGVEGDEVLHSEDTVHVSRVISDISK